MGIKKTASIVIILFLLIVGVRYYQYVHLGNFKVYADISCDPSEDSCFTYEDDEEIYYKKVLIRYNLMPRCLEEHNCESFSCSELNQEDCEVLSCSDGLLEEWESCANN